MPPIDPLYWAAAAIPLALLMITLVAFRWKAHEAASVGMFAALLVAFGVYEMDLSGLAVASAVGVWEAVAILYIIIPSLIFYHVIDRANGFDALREQVKSFTENELFLVLAAGWVFVSFMQSITGFGTPIVVVAPILLALGVKPVYAVAIPLIGHAWANTFGTLGVAWVTLEGVVDIQDVLLTALSTGLLLWVVNVIAGLTIAYIYGRRTAVRHAIPMVTVISLVHGGGQLLGIYFWEPAFANFFAATLAMLTLAPLSRLPRYAAQFDAVDSRPAMKESVTDMDDKGQPPAVADGGTAAASVDLKGELKADDLMSLKLAALPFAVLAVIAFVTGILDPLSEALETIQIVVPLPGVETGLGVETDALSASDGIAVLNYPGTFLLVSSLVAYAVFRYTGHYATADDVGSKDGFTTTVLRSALPASVAVVGFLVMALVMDYSGQVTVLAQGVATVATAESYGVLSPLIGALGAFMTSSNTASNILFGGLQLETAQSLGTSGSWILAGQTAGGAIGNAISPANVILGTTAVGIVGREGDVLRKVIPWVAGVCAITGVLIVLATTIGFLGVV
ncbi:L-lactate permease [Natronolimnohabitans innermongolicus]|uniref:Lactate permease family protein n=1 Tax=Natronolimnohabitans innermongolicus JCM 12255 TaxID=1227499 RepID=L9WLC6_9EURY|nr:L-lactate permease [Natronolimnohabitans innermongolicus]ELY50187.1 lactate permease family protein [Natronolimnohabitans innermongolicus JCM 12255]